MEHFRCIRRGVSLIELIVVIGILAIMIGLLLPAVMSVRQSVNKISSTNKLRQLSIGLQHYISSNEGRLPGPRDRRFFDSASDTLPLHCSAIYTDSNYATTGYMVETPHNQRPPYWNWRPMFMSPADPSIVMLRDYANKNSDYQYHDVTSYTANMFAFDSRPSIQSGFGDGTSSTICLVEGYCFLPSKPPVNVFTSGSYDIYYPPGYASGVYQNRQRAATFADISYRDVIPVSSGSPVITRSSKHSVTFLSRPSFSSWDWNTINSSYSDGLLVAYFDGSVRFLRKDIAESAFWGQVTRNAGDIAE